MDHDRRDVATAFAGRFGTSPTAVASAPGRVNLVGGHVDYCDGVVLPVAIDRSTVAAARPRADATVRAYSTLVDDEFAAPVDDHVPSSGGDTDGWAAYVLGTAATLAATVDRPVGADLFVDGDVPVGAGLASSASLEVAVAGALVAVHDLDIDPRRIADLCWRAETEAVGVDCGIMDQYACALARPDHALRLDCRSRAVEHVPVADDRLRLLVVDTGVERELADSGYNDRVRECRAATERLDAVLDRPVESLRDVSPADVEAHLDGLPAPLDRRARHVTTEIRRAEAAADALREGDVATVGRLVHESHRSLRDDHEVSCAEVDAAVDALDDHDGVYGARMVGGGWGGSVVALVRPGVEDSVTDHVVARYREATGIDCEVRAFVVAGGLEAETVAFD